MKTFFDIVQNNEFRESVSKIINTPLTDKIPMLYRYQRFADYCINDILNNQITLSSIIQFNDVYDSTIHALGSQNKAYEEWDELKNLCDSARIAPLLDEEYYIYLKKKTLQRESDLNFRLIEYLKFYICCFSTDYSSQLMWSHYADSNKGVCIEYDFSKLPKDHLLKQLVFPVTYLEKPLDLTKMLSDKENKIYDYSLETAIMCSTLSKSIEWKYEKEWRIVFPPLDFSKNDKRLTLINFTTPSKIYLGYHFFKSFFYYNYLDSDFYKEESDKEKEKETEPNKDIETCKYNMELFTKLLNYIECNNINIALMIPEIGCYNMTYKNISVNLLKKLFNDFFKNSPKNIRFYYVFLDSLLNLANDE